MLFSFILILVCVGFQDFFTGTEPAHFESESNDILPIICKKIPLEWWSDTLRPILQNSHGVSSPLWNGKVKNQWFVYCLNLVKVYFLLVSIPQWLSAFSYLVKQLDDLSTICIPSASLAGHLKLLLVESVLTIPSISMQFLSFGRLIRFFCWERIPP